MACLLAFLMLVGAMASGASAQGDPASTGFIYLDGERIPADDERVINIVPVVMPGRERAAVCRPSAESSPCRASSRSAPTWSCNKTVKMVAKD